MSIKHLCIFLSFSCLIIPSVSAREKIADVKKAAQKIVAGTNDFRKEQGREKVKSNKLLTDTAIEFARFLSRSDKFGHEADGRRHDQRAKDNGYDYCIVLENIAFQHDSKGFRTDDLARAFVQGWEKSPGHRKNMLDPDVTEIGVGVVRNDETGYYYAVQLFGLPRSGEIKFEIVNASGMDAAYSLGSRSFSLASSYTRTHRECGAAKFEFQGVGVLPKDGDHFRIVKDGPGKLQLIKE